MTEEQRAAAVAALDQLAGHFEDLRDETNRPEYSKPLPEIYTARDMWDRAADMTRRTALDYRNGWTPGPDS